jgi:hypothetical protein
MEKSSIHGGLSIAMFEYQMIIPYDNLIFVLEAEGSGQESNQESNSQQAQVPVRTLGGYQLWTKERQVQMFAGRKKHGPHGPKCIKMPRLLKEYRRKLQTICPAFGLHILSSSTLGIFREDPCWPLWPQESVRHVTNVLA